MSGRIQTLRMTVNLEASDLLHEMATNCNISFADLKVNNSSHFGELFEFGPLKTPQMLEFGWEWMIQKIISENLVTPSQITQQFIERLSSFNYTDYVIEMKLLIDSAEKNKYHRIFDINKILPKKKNNSVDLKKRLYEVVVTPFQTKLTPFRVRTYSGETYEHNEVYKKITDGSGDVVIVRFDSEDMMVNDFLVSVMNHYVNLPYTMFLSGTKYKVYSFLLGTSSVVFVKEGVDIKMERRDIAFSFLRDMDEMWKFNYVLDVCLEKLKTSQDKDCCVEIVRDYWPDVKSLFMLYSSDPLDEQLKFDVLRYNKIFLYDKYKVRMQDKWICDNNIIKLKNDFFSDFSSRPEKIKVVGEVRLSVTLSKILSLFSFDPSLKSILLKPRVDVLDTLTYDLYNIVQYIKKTKPQGLMNISYCAPKK
ncbi:hypothetical protein EIN_224530 [Entamoeba invadens IP1]|uniref:Uncharacterized protein n=1 Tax=Entamoeba invadens IP1 TaxID=370355 RepID=A0A0A1U5R8_ENTIV|nr:hypothetical protein EIN_224530 [Entamoeba invadens IP1]ELP88210.1 hypothetical protein EIN_224530 [Entamoeba invadens IP1]|eukprot:XP_004254981.1 hypothetical protein EIN_224530 [Entamoeba invadens IP1]